MSFPFDCITEFMFFDKMCDERNAEGSSIFQTSHPELGSLICKAYPVNHGVKERK